MYDEVETISKEVVSICGGLVGIDDLLYLQLASLLAWQ